MPVLVMLALLGAAVALPAVGNERPVTIQSPRLGSFVADRRALAVGDALTVLVAEVASSSTEASSRSSREEAVGVDLRRQPDGTRRWGAGWDVADGGGGAIERSNRVLARITVTVVGIDEAGQLVLHGDQDIVVNNETQRIRLDGKVRWEDVQADNTVPSWRLNGARIELVGKGVLGRAQSPGLLSRLFGILGFD